MTLQMTLTTPAAITPPHQAAPIKTGVSLVVIDFLALGRDGRPVTDLKPGDVTLRVGGRARTIEALNLVDAVSGGRPAPVLPAASAIPNQHPGGGLA
jgi:hypothetical protein